MNLQPDEHGRLWLAPARIRLGLRDDVLECYDAQGNRIGDYVKVVEAYKEAEARAAEAEQRAVAEAQARAEVEARLRALEEELRRLRGAAT